MSSSSSSQSRHDPAEPSSSRSAYVQDVQDDGDINNNTASDYDTTADLLKHDQSNGLLDDQYETVTFIFIDVC